MDFYRPLRPRPSPANPFFPDFSLSRSLVIPLTLADVTPSVGGISCILWRATQVLAEPTVMSFLLCTPSLGTSSSRRLLSLNCPGLFRMRVTRYPVVGRAVCTMILARIVGCLRPRERRNTEAKHFSSAGLRRVYQSVQNCERLCRRKLLCGRDWGEVIAD